MCIIEDYENGYSIEDIAYTYSISESRVLKVLKDYGNIDYVQDE